MAATLDGGPRCGMTARATGVESGSARVIHSNSTAHPATTTSHSGLTPRRLWIVLGALMLATALSAIDGTIVTTALPTIVGELKGVDSFAWVGSAYVLASTISTPLLGKLGDLYGRKRVMLAIIVLFVVGSLLCGLSRSMPQLIAARAVQGLGGGGIQALTFAILGDLVSPRERGRYMGMYTGIFAAASVVGPLVGGWMIDNFAWPWIFLVNLPIGMIAFVAILVTLDVKFPHRSARLDLAGAALLSLALGSGVIGLDRARSGWRADSWALIVVALFAMAAFVLVEQRVSEPVIPLRLFRNPVFCVASLMGALAGSVAFGAIPFLTLQFQDANFVSPTKAGLYLAPMMVGIMAGSAVGGNLIARTGRYKWLPVSALGLSVIGLVAISQITSTMSIGWLAIPLVFIGAGSGATFTTTSIATQNAIAAKDLGVATAALLSMRQLGGSVALALYGTLFSVTVERELRAGLPPSARASGRAASSLVREPSAIKALAPDIQGVVVRAVTSGTGRVFLVAVPVGIIAFLVAWILPERPLSKRSGIESSEPTATH